MLSIKWMLSGIFALLIGVLFVILTFISSVALFFVGLFFVLLAIVMFIVGLVLKR